MLGQVLRRRSGRAGRRSRPGRRRGPPGRSAARRGTACPSSRATLSNASPAASSMVAPSGVTPRGQVVDPQQRRVPARDQQRDRGLGQRAVLQGVDGDVRGEVVHAVDRLLGGERVALGRRRRRPAARRPGPARRSRRSRRCRPGSTPASSRARCMVGTIASRWARLATSGTTPPKRACSSTLDASASASRVCPRTMPTPVSSQQVSMPRTSGSSAHAHRLVTLHHQGVGVARLVVAAAHADRLEAVAWRRAAGRARCPPPPPAAPAGAAAGRPRRAAPPAAPGRCRAAARPGAPRCCCTHASSGWPTASPA